MADMHEYSLDGCAPTPLASYLKALGVLRLVSSPENNVKGEAADPAARGWWANERFHLRTRLHRDVLLRFFLEDYVPSPIISPWNGGSGFYYREGKTGEKDPATGKLIKTGVRNAPTEATRRVDAIAKSSCARFSSLVEAIATARAAIQEFNLDQAPDPKTGRKAAFIERYRSLANERAAGWVDAALAIAGEQLDPAALLGSGGNDGNLDFSTAFQSALLDLFELETGQARDYAKGALDSALLNRANVSVGVTGVSQLAPGSIAAANSGNGFVGAEQGDLWSLVLMFEGAIAFAGTATRRSAANRPRGSFPFTVSQLASGSGAVGGNDNESSRAAELWLPLWHRPATFTELRALLGEGRAHLGRMEARDGLTFARAVATLGVSRGIAEFERVAFEARYGNMFITVPLGRFRVPNGPHRDLIADLDAGGWLARLRSALGTNVPARARIARRWLDDALFEIAREGAPAENLQLALVALGGVVSWLATSREGRKKVSPPPRLGPEWVRCADYASAEFRIAAALASIGWRPDGGEQQEHENAPNSAPDDEPAANAIDAALRAPSTDESLIERPLPPPMAAHFAPIVEETIDRRIRQWAVSDPPTVVWSSGNLVQNMIAVLDRRLVEQARRGLGDKPLAGAVPARLADIAAFLGGPFDDARCAALLAGLVWAQPAQLPPRQEDKKVGPIPFAYAALKPLFTPDAHLRARPESKPDRRQYLPDGSALAIPPGLLARLRRGAIGEAVREALRRARASGIGSPFQATRSFAATVDPARLAAALLIPIDEFALTYLMQRAYPLDERQEETDDAA